MHKLTIVYHRLEDPSQFDEEYYLEKHMPRAYEEFGKYGITRIELEKVISAPGDRPPDFYRLGHVYADAFDSMAQLQRALTSPEAVELSKDMRNFAKGKVSFVISEVNRIFKIGNTLYYGGA